MLDKYLNGYSDKLSLGNWNIHLDKKDLLHMAQDPNFHPIKMYNQHKNDCK